MPEGLLVAGIFIGVVACVLGYTQVLGPRRQKQRVAEALLAAGWVPHDPSSDEAAGLVESLAVQGPLGAQWEATYAEQLGPVTSQVRVRKTTRGASERVFRDASSTRPRYAGIASTTQTTRSKSNLDLGQTRMAIGRILWIGEARRLPVEKVETVVYGLGEVLGAVARSFAEGRGLAPASRPEIAEPPQHALAERLRAVMQAGGVGRSFAGSLYLAPQAWALVAPVARLGSRESALLQTAREISTALD